MRLKCNFEAFVCSMTTSCGYAGVEEPGVFCCCEKYVISVYVMTCVFLKFSSLLGVEFVCALVLKYSVQPLS